MEALFSDRFLSKKKKYINKMNKIKKSSCISSYLGYNNRCENMGFCRKCFKKPQQSIGGKNL